MAKNKNGKILPQALKAAPDFLQNAIVNWLGAAGFLIAVAFFLQTRDSAQVKITLFHCAALGAAALWLCKLFYQRVNILNKINFKKLLPFLLFFIYTLCSYFFAPHLLGRAGPFAYFLSAAVIFTVCVFEAAPAALQKIFSWLIAACWVVYGYGVLQIINNFVLPGADPLFWTDFFGSRVFSTMANPNFLADFCLFSLAVIFARFLQTRDKKLLLLLALGFANMFFSESKGAWLAFVFGALIFAGVYFFCFTGLYKKHKLKIAASALVLVFIFLAGTAWFGAKRMRSVNFRVYTWAAAVEMIKDKPLLGRGAGSFFIEYAAYKKPQIFYIEQRHNAQTHHAENYYLELLANLGIAGFILFAWATLYLLWGVYLSFKKFDFKTASAEQKQQAFLLLGASGGLIAVYTHNFVDISLFLPSSGYFAAMLAGGVFALTRGPLAAQDILQSPPKKPTKLFYIFALLACVLIAIIAGLVFKDFVFMTFGLFAARPLLFLISWFFVILIICGVVYTFAKTIFTYKTIINTFILGAVAVMMYFAFGFMRADNYIARAASLAERGETSAALAEYTKAIKLNPFSSPLYNYRLMLFTARLDMAKTNRPKEGDCETCVSNDYERALNDFEAAFKLNPNEPLLFYNLGTLQRAASLKTPQLFGQLNAQSRESFKKALILDPVFESIYFQLANIEFDAQNPRAAYEWLSKYIQGPPGVTEPDYLKQHRENKTALSHLKSFGAVARVK